MSKRMVPTVAEAFRGEPLRGFRWAGGDVVDDSRFNTRPPETASDDATLVMLGDADGLLAAFALRDELRSDAAVAIDRLRELGLQVEILSGDALGPVQRVAADQEIEICAFRAEEWIACLFTQGYMAAIAAGIAHGMAGLAGEILAVHLVHLNAVFPG